VKSDEEEPAGSGIKRLLLPRKNSRKLGLVRGQLQRRSAKGFLPTVSTTKSGSWGASPPILAMYPQSQNQFANR